MANKNVTFSAETLLGSGMARKASKYLKGRKSRIDQALEKAQGKKKKK